MDYEKIGLKCGIEIHQQLDTHKLFCNCPSVIREDKTDIEVTRLMNLSVGETGEIDKAAQHEKLKNKSFRYLGYSDTTCLVEFDEEPPHEMNMDALKISLTVAKMLNATFVDKINVMRKIVIDGSNTSGFQRTSLVALNGQVETKEGIVSVPSVCLEEDSAKIVERKNEVDTYNLSRLGIPLIEIATGPDIKTPEQAKNVCSYIGMLLRSTRRVKRGLGTIRQDVNVSIKNGNRVEIKGAQDLRSIPKLIDNEIVRQQSLLDIKKELVDKIKTFIEPEIVNVTKIFEKTESKVIRTALDKKGVVFAINLKGFKGLVGKEITPGRRLGTEFSDYGKMAGVGGLFHTDEMPNYGITQKEVDKLNKILECDKDDAFIMVADLEEKSRAALEKVIQRAKLCFVEVPKEVRKANQDASTSFLRPMPGSARMYPETDIKLITNYYSTEIDIPKTLHEQAKDLEKKYGLSKDLSLSIIDSEFFDLFLDMVKRYHNIKPAYIAENLIGIKKDIKKNYNKEVDVAQTDFEIVFNALDRGQISKDSVIEIFSRIDEKLTSEIVKEYKLMDESEIKIILEKIVADNKDQKINVLMGLAMKELRGKADGKKIMQILNELIKK